MRTVRFGVFEVNRAAGELRKGGVRIKLQEQPFQLLCALIENPGEVVTREELRQRLWPEDTYVDFDRSLNTAASRLREALGDSAANPRFVETLPRRGYRFVAPVAGDDTKQSAGPVESRVSRPWRLAATFAIGIVFAVAAWHWFVRTGPPAPELKVTQFTSFPGEEIAPAFSPDGNQIAYVWNGENRDNFDIYVQQVGAAGRQRLTTDPASDLSPTWSPEGQRIAFLRQSEDDPWRLQMLIVPALGGPERHVAEIASTWNGSRQRVNWSPAGDVIVVEQWERDKPPRLVSLSPDGDQKPFSSAGRSPIFSPDGEMLALLRGDFMAWGIHTLPLSGVPAPETEPRRITDDESEIRGLAWSADGRRLVFGSNRAGSFSLWSVEASGGEPERLAVGGDDAVQPAIARQGNRLAYVRRNPAKDIWRTSGPCADTAATSAPLITSTRGDGHPRYSPDGQRIAFGSSRSGNSEVYVCNSDGTNTVRLTRREGSDADPEWSPDGRRIALDYRKGRSQDIWVVNADGSGLRQFTTHAAQDARPSWSRDGEWIYFGSSRGGSWQVWKKPADGGEAVQVTKNGGRQSYESADSRFIYYTRVPPTRGIWRAPADGGEEVHVAEHGVQNFWTLTDEGPMILRRLQGRVVVECFDLSQGRLKTIAELPKDAGAPVEVSPDGQWLLFGMSRAESDIMLVENFR